MSCRVHMNDDNDGDDDGDDEEGGFWLRFWLYTLGEKGGEEKMCVS